jgi:hypothetical protein
MNKATLIGLLLALAIGIMNSPSTVLAQGYGWSSWGHNRNAPQQLEGTWYLNGEQSRKTEINASRRGLVARNERGQTTRLEISRSGDVYARDWQGGLRGDVRRGRIEWENGTTWTREPSYRTAKRR